MTLKVATRVALGNYADLTTPSLLQSSFYKLGQIIDVENSDKTAKQSYMYIKSHDALVQYKPYVITPGGTDGAEVITAEMPTDGHLAPGPTIGVPQVAFTSGYYGFVLIRGNGYGLIGSEAHEIGDMLTVNDTSTTFIVDGSTGATAYSVNTFAICQTTGADAETIAIYLIGRQAVIANATP